MGGEGRGAEGRGPVKGGMWEWGEVSDGVGGR